MEIINSDQRTLQGLRKPHSNVHGIITHMHESIYLIMMLNVVSVSGISKSSSLIEIPQVTPEVWVVDDTFLVALHEC